MSLLEESLKRFKHLIKNPAVLRDGKFLHLVSVYEVTKDHYLLDAIMHYIEMFNAMADPTVDDSPFECPLDPSETAGAFPLGKTVLGFEYSITPEILNKHLSIVGSSGSGKSNLNLILLKAILSRM